MKARKVLTQGIVQGVGFRPYVYRLASDLNLKGYVRNLGNVVEIIIEGENAELFIERLPDELPPIAKIDSMIIEDIEAKDYSNFEIIESGDAYSGISVIPPDIAICDKCLEEIRNPNDRRYKYPFNACTDCGPRFTVIESVPYDRVRTTMEEFPLCDECLVEYRQPLNRRYHGEAICCNDCGPQMDFYEGVNKIDCENPIKMGAEVLEKGKILAIKGIGGTHLVVDAYNDEAIKELRSRLNRPNQAFAVMSKDLESVQNYAQTSKKEIETITSNKRPIVILKKNENYPFPESLSPGLHNIGVMLPYSPMHYLLFDESDIDTYVMTSANTPGEPMMIKNDDIINGIKTIDSANEFNIVGATPRSARSNRRHILFDGNTCLRVIPRKREINGSCRDLRQLVLSQVFCQIPEAFQNILLTNLFDIVVNLYRANTRSNINEDIRKTFLNSEHPCVSRKAETQIDNRRAKFDKHVIIAVGTNNNMFHFRISVVFRNNWRRYWSGDKRRNRFRYLIWSSKHFFACNSNLFSIFYRKRNKANLVATAQLSHFP